MFRNFIDSERASAFIDSERASALLDKRMSSSFCHYSSNAYILSTFEPLALANTRQQAHTH